MKTSSKAKPKPRKTVAAKKGKTRTKAAYNKAAYNKAAYNKAVKRTVTLSGKGPRKLSKKPAKKGKKVTKKAYSRAAKR